MIRRIAISLTGLVGCTGTVDGRDSSEKRGPEEIRAEILGASTALKSQGKTEQAAIFEDGVIDEVEYRDALDSLRTCIESKG